MKALYLATAIGLMVAQTAFAQPNKTMSPDKVLEIGDASFGKSDTYNALEWYTKAYEQNNENVYAIAQVAQTHEKLRDYKEAVIWYERLVKADKKGEYPLARFKYAYVLKLSAKYNESIAEFMSFMQAYNGEDAARYKKLSEIEIEGARWALQNPNPYEPLVVENLGKNVNSPSSEDGPTAVGRDQIIYSSLRTDTIIYVDEAPEDKKIAKLYSSTRAEDGKGWTECKEYNSTIVQKGGFHAVHPTFTPDQSKFYFVRAQLEGNMLKNSRIFVCTHKDGILGEPQSLAFNSPTYICKNPSVGVIDGIQYLFFSSNMDGGKGGFDIWYAEINADGTTKQPLNMGDAINTIADDITPFYDTRENILYFSSQGHPTVGGFDVFKSKKDGNSFSKPENMGFGFNSRVDDFGFMINQVGNDDCYGYVVSNRPGTISMKSETCCDDIFSVLMPDRCDITATVTVIDQDNKKPLKGATVQVIDKATGKVVDEQTNTEGNEFIFNLSANKEYDIVSLKPGFEKPNSQTKISTLKQDIGEVTKPMTLSKETFLREFGLVVETYNAKSQAPLNGVSITIIEASTGKELKSEKADDKNRYTFGMVRDREYKIVAKREGFTNESRVMTLQQVQAGELQKLYLVPMELPLFYDVLFDFNRHDLRKGALDTLNIILTTLKDYPNLVVEVRGHTDGLGSDGYNDKLSAKRSNASIEWLEKQGIGRERMVPKAFGKKDPRAENEIDGKDNPEGRQLNRRVEFKIIDAKDSGVTESGKPVTPEPTPTPKPADKKGDKMNKKPNTDSKNDKMNNKSNTDDKSKKMDDKKKN
jgi:outer membrane protein OmpA-like peptidoglycan-associated protein/tetratricopeptide (TPR) repeat protein